MNEYIFERVTPQHYVLLKDLYLNAFNLKISIPEIQRRFDTIQLGCSHIGFIAICPETRIAAAYYGVFPMQAIHREEIIQIAQSGDTMTHSSHRKKGLFVKLAEKTYAACENENIKIIIGQPNKNSYHGLVNSLGWKPLDEILRWDLTLKFKTFPIAKISSVSGYIKKLHLKYAAFLLKKYIIATPLSFNNSTETNFLKINRNSFYLKYKNSLNKFFLSVEGITFWVSLTDVFWIGDISSYNEMTHEILNKIKKIAFSLGYNTISFNINKSISLPSVFGYFKIYNSEHSCFFYIDKKYEGKNFLLTAADFDTW